MSRRKRANLSVMNSTAPASIPQPRPTVLAAELPSARKPEESSDPYLRRALQQAAEGHYEKALETLKMAKGTKAVSNARGVCLLRLGRAEDAIRVYRGLVLQSGQNFAKPDVPTEYVLNFATSLFLSGSPSGCLSLICYLDEVQHPSVRRLRDAVRSWVKTLSFWQRVNWWCGEIEPHDCRPSIDFPAGDFTEWFPESADAVDPNTSVFLHTEESVS